MGVHIIILYASEKEIVAEINASAAGGGGFAVADVKKTLVEQEKRHYKTCFNCLLFVTLRYKT